MTEICHLIFLMKRAKEPVMANRILNWEQNTLCEVENKRHLSSNTVFTIKTTKIDCNNQMSTTNQWWVNCCSTFNDSGPIYSVKLTCSSCPLFLTGLKPPRKSEDSECM